MSLISHEMSIFITKKLLDSKTYSNHGVVIKKEFSTNFGGTGKERAEREICRQSITSVVLT
jgi:hypothetical protein